MKECLDLQTRQEHSGVTVDHSVGNWRSFLKHDICHSCLGFVDPGNYWTFVLLTHWIGGTEKFMSVVMTPNRLNLSSSHSCLRLVGFRCGHTAEQRSGSS